MLPYIPTTPKTVAIIPGTAINPVLLQDDGSLDCKYLKCRRSVIGLTDWVGMGFDSASGCARFLAMGGHSDHGANSVYRFCVGDLGWTQEFGYSPLKPPFPTLVDIDGNGILDCPMPEEGPTGTHS